MPQRVGTARCRASSGTILQMIQFFELRFLLLSSSLRELFLFRPWCRGYEPSQKIPLGIRREQVGQLEFEPG